MTDQTSWGFPQECEDFNLRNARFIGVFGRLEALIKDLFGREVQVPSRLDQFLFLFGGLVVEDFFEILLLAANGYGTGALKLVRSMFELATTARYLEGHPAELDNFIDFHWVASRKLFRATTDTFGNGSSGGGIGVSPLF